jgi:hypothetical protein
VASELAAYLPSYKNNQYVGQRTWIGKCTSGSLVNLRLTDNTWVLSSQDGKYSDSSGSVGGYEAQNRQITFSDNPFSKMQCNLVTAPLTIENKSSDHHMQCNNDLAAGNIKTFLDCPTVDFVPESQQPATAPAPAASSVIGKWEAKCSSADRLVKYTFEFKTDSLTVTNELPSSGGHWVKPGVNMAYFQELYQNSSFSTSEIDYSSNTEVVIFQSPLPSVKCTLAGDKLKCDIGLFVGIVGENGSAITPTCPAPLALTRK